MQKVTFKSLAGGWYRLNQGPPGKPIIVRQASVDRIRREWFNRLNPRKSAPLAPPPAPPIPLIILEWSYGEWKGKCVNEACRHTHYVASADVGTLYRCSYCRTVMRVAKSGRKSR